MISHLLDVIFTLQKVVPRNLFLLNIDHLPIIGGSQIDKSITLNVLIKCHETDKLVNIYICALVHCLLSKLFPINTRSDFSPISHHNERRR